LLMLLRKGAKISLARNLPGPSSFAGRFAADDQTCMRYKSDKENRWQAAADLKSYLNLTT